MADPQPNVDSRFLQAVDGQTLFYPHARKDFALPIRLFAPFVSDFWFADIQYFNSSDPVETTPPVLSKDREFELVSVNIEGKTASDIGDPSQKSRCVRSETYRHILSGRHFNVHRRRGDSVAAFHELESIGVFFYRRDSDEGSNIKWLEASHRRPRQGRWLAEDLMAKIINNGLIVTDGSKSQAFGRNPYANFRRDKPIDPEDVRSIEPFTDYDGRKFECVGYAGEGDGPVLIWQVTYSVT